MKNECDYDEEDLDLDDLLDDECDEDADDDDVWCNHLEQASCADCPDFMTCKYLDFLLSFADDNPSFQCRHDGECGGCPDFYECPIIFGGDEEW